MSSGRFSPSLRAMQTLEAVARSGSLSRAAVELGVTVAAVSFQLREIEQVVGRRLVKRDGRGLWIDSSAATAAAEMSAPFARLALTAKKLRTRPEGATAKITMLSSFAAIWFLPRLPSFRAANPDIDVQVITGTRLVDLPGEEIDCAIRCGPGGWPDVDCSRLFAQRLGPVAHPAYLERNGRPSDVDDLVTQRLIVSEGRMAEWHEWFDAAGADFPESISMHQVEGRDLALAAVRAQAGIGLLDLSLIADSILRRELIQLFPTEISSGWSHWFVTPDGETAEPVRRLRHWLLSQVGTNDDVSLSA